MFERRTMTLRRWLRGRGWKRRLSWFTTQLYNSHVNFCVCVGVGKQGVGGLVNIFRDAIDTLWVGQAKCKEAIEAMIDGKTNEVSACPGCGWKQLE